MIMDQDSIPHAFCISKFERGPHAMFSQSPTNVSCGCSAYILMVIDHSETMAEKVKTWIDEIVAVE
jgi:hypothetical protein